LWLKGFPRQASILADESVELALETQHATSICLSLAIAGCPIKLWNKETISAQRCIGLLEDYARAANSTYWQIFAEIFRVALDALNQSPAGAEPGMPHVKQDWDFKHFEYLSVLRESSIPASLLQRVKEDRCWWCAPEILRLKALGLVAQGGEERLSQAQEFLQQGLAIAQEHGALMWRLRINTSLAVLYRNNHLLPLRLQQLDATVSEFSEGLEFPDLRVAIEFLESQGAGR
jgi:hypothetical protein